jgi:hypothetical protein
LNELSGNGKPELFFLSPFSFFLHAAVPSQEHKENLQALPRMSGLNGGARLN